MYNPGLKTVLARTVKSANCMEWTGALNGSGRPVTRAMGKLWIVARLVYTYAVGPIPAGLNVCHSCDNGKCINPDHLSAETQKKNQQDAAKRGRFRRQNSTACIHGHEYTEADWVTILSGPREGRKFRICRRCGSDRKRRIKNLKNGA